jgi:hypothetical protein
MQVNRFILRRIKMSEIKYEITKKIGILSTSTSGWSKQLNLISWCISCMG